MLFKKIILACVSFITIQSFNSFCANNPKKPKCKKIRIFKTKEDLEKAFEVLWARERTLVQKDKFVIGNPDLVCYQKDLNFFYQRVFRTIVADDIKRGLVYTRAYSMRVQQDGRVTTKNPPLSISRATTQSILLTKLSLNPKDVLMQSKLKALYKRNRLKKTSDNFFPTIIVNQEINNFIGEYDEATNEISINPYHFSLAQYSSLIHEFTHARQWWNVTAMGGFGSAPIKKKYTHSFFVQKEIEADKEGLKHHPKPKLLTQWLENIWHSAIKQEQCFPYFTVQEMYAFLLKNFKISGKEPYTTEAMKAYDLRKKTVLSAFKKKTKKNIFKKYPLLASMVHEEAIDGNKLKRDDILKGLSNPKACLSDIHSRGCQQFIKIKESLGLMST